MVLLLLGLRSYLCNYCKKSFTKTCNLNSHIKAVHNGVKAFECRDCRKSFSRNSDLQKHIDAVHKGLRPYQCSVCQKQFSQKSSLKRHKEAVHEGECYFNANLKPTFWYFVNYFLLTSNFLSNRNRLFCCKYFPSQPKMHVHAK